MDESCLCSRHAMKLKYFYIICFLVCIDWSFCYEYINNEKAMHPHVSIKRNTKPKYGRHKNQHRRTRRQEYEEEKDPVANIDIASFIQQPDADYEAVEDPNQVNNRRRANRYYDDFDSLTEMQVSLEKSANARLRNDFEASNILYGEKMSDLDKLKKSLTSDSQDLRSNQEIGAKVPRRRQAIPFFSRNKKDKKNDKRNLFNFGFKKASMTTLLPKCDGPKLDLKNNFSTKVKRSSLDRFCPLCKRKIGPKGKKNKQKASRKTIHNSRQFFQNLGDANQNKQKENSSNNDYRNIKANDENYKDRKVGISRGISNRYDRKKRDNDEVPDQYDVKESQHSKRCDAVDTNKERQLQELEKTQKKVDSLEFNFPLNAPSPNVGKELSI